jgi:hypothetical protein
MPQHACTRAPLARQRQPHAARLVRVDVGKQHQQLSILTQVDLQGLRPWGVIRSFQGGALALDQIRNP